jgi:hypothetical protein
MGSPVDLIELTNTDRAFYTTLGPFLSRREVTQAVGGPLWDDDAKTWIVARRGRRVAGFVGVAARGGRTHVESLYTPGLADGGLDLEVAAGLLAAVVDRFGDRTLHGKVRRSRAAPYLGVGFTEVETGSTAQYAHLIRDPKESAR